MAAPASDDRDRHAMKPRRSRLGVLGRIVLAAACLMFLGTRVAATAPVTPASLPTAPKAMPQLWGVEVDGETLQALDGKRAAGMRAVGMTLIVPPGRLTAQEQVRLVKRARRWRLPVIAPVSAEASAVCTADKATAPGLRCGVRATSVSNAGILAERGAVDLILVHAGSTAAFRRLRGRDGVRVAGVVDLRSTGYSAHRWRAAVRTAQQSSNLDLVVRPVGNHRGAALDRFTRALTASQRGADRRAPSAPTRVSIARADRRSADVRWTRSSDDRRVVRYGLYRDGAYIRSVSTAATTLTGLRCAPHLLEVDAVDAVGNRSPKTSVRVAAEGCAAPATAAADPGATTAANLWVDASGGSCARRAAPAPYDDAAACGSLDAANDVCQAGDLVLIKGGTYPEQHVTGDNGRAADCKLWVVIGEAMVLNGALMFESAARVHLGGGGARNGVGARLVTSTIPNSGSPRNQYPLEVIGGGNAGGQSSSVTVQGTDVGGWKIENSTNVTIRDNDIGPCDAVDEDAGGNDCDNGSIEYCEPGLALGADRACTGYNEGHVVEGNLIHDFGTDDSLYTGGGSNDPHWECMYVSYPRNLTIRGNTFVNCANGGNIFFTYANGGGTFEADYGYTNVVIENNVFTTTCDSSSPPCGGRADFAFGISGHCNLYGGVDLTDVVIRHNTFLGGAGFDSSGGCTQGNPGVTLSGNVRLGNSAQSSCGADGAWELPPTSVNEVFYGGAVTCARDARTLGVAATALDPLVASNSATAPDAHLKGPRGPLDGFVAAECPERDIDGQPRPATGCDAGADER
ncbi:hypothetical protein DVA67_029990 [Solirubrobacter sp. CPCC 204708]|uniref:Right-handed parallel beta-helix repeat-containing protein n=1 Tax=Solirubrobacter deserti TaxID=2282478 RepID=A0ABT4RIN1_9ACTN|nr:right-handed parallel beta-helix repeat-containing protein [Solirubrobacter deserti]MBE2320236.1 hypothetical protein [Solirubrobacter deserti]MDA0138378.1 right-handed parallel beta-helix repeat-containing protein [Solirubrobacter deserti]